MINLTRRQFLQAMLATASATVLPSLRWADDWLDEPVGAIQVSIDGIPLVNVSSFSIEITSSFSEAQRIAMHFTCGENWKVHSMALSPGAKKVSINLLEEGILLHGDIVFDVSMWRDEHGKYTDIDAIIANLPLTAEVRT